MWVHHALFSNYFLLLLSNRGNFYFLVSFYFPWSSDINTLVIEYEYFYKWIWILICISIKNIDVLIYASDNDLSHKSIAQLLSSNFSFLISFYLLVWSKTHRNEFYLLKMFILVIMDDYTETKLTHIYCVCVLKIMEFFKENTP
jgi:hypothetical protein